MLNTNPNPHDCSDVDSIERLDYMNMNVEVTSLMPLHVICGYNVRDYLVMYTIEGERENIGDVSRIHQMYSFIHNSDHHHHLPSASQSTTLLDT